MAKEKVNVDLNIDTEQAQKKIKDLNKALQNFDDSLVVYTGKLANSDSMFRGSKLGQDAIEGLRDVDEILENAISNFVEQLKKEVDNPKNSNEKRLRRYEREIHTQAVKIAKEDELSLRGVVPRGQGTETGKYTKSQLSRIRVQDLDVDFLKQIENDLKTKNPFIPSEKIPKVFEDFMKEWASGKKEWGSTKGGSISKIQKTIEFFTDKMRSGGGERISSYSLNIEGGEQKIKEIKKKQGLLEEIMGESTAASTIESLDKIMDLVYDSEAVFTKLNLRYRRAYEKVKESAEERAYQEGKVALAQLPNNTIKGRERQYINAFNDAQQIKKNHVSYEDYQNGTQVPDAWKKSYEKAESLFSMSVKELTKKEKENILLSILAEDALNSMAQTQQTGSAEDYSRAFFSRKPLGTFSKNGNIITGGYVNQSTGALVPNYSIKINSDALKNKENIGGVGNLSGKSLFQIGEAYEKLMSEAQKGGDAGKKAEKFASTIISTIFEAINNTKTDDIVNAVKKKITGAVFDPEASPEEREYYSKGRLFEDLRKVELSKIDDFNMELKRDNRTGRLEDMSLMGQELTHQYDPKEVKKAEKKKRKDERDEEAEIKEAIDVNNRFIEESLQDTLFDIVQDQGGDAGKEFVKTYLAQIGESLRGSQQLPEEGVANISSEKVGKSGGRYVVEPEYDKFEQYDENAFEMRQSNYIDDETGDDKENADVEKKEDDIVKTYRSFVEKILKIVQGLRDITAQSGDIKSSTAYGSIEAYLQKALETAGGQGLKSIEQNVSESFNRIANVITRSIVTDQAIGLYSQETGIPIEELLERSFWSNDSVDVNMANKVKYETSKKAREAFFTGLANYYGSEEEARIQISLGNFEGLEDGLKGFFSVADREIAKIQTQLQSFKDDPELYKSFKQGLANQLFQGKDSYNTVQNEGRIKTVQPSLPYRMSNKLEGLSLKEKFIGMYGGGQYVLAPYGANTPEQAVQVIGKRLEELISKENFTETDEREFDKLQEDLGILQETVRRQNEQYAGTTAYKQDSANQAKKEAEQKQFSSLVTTFI